jgi:putative hydrolase
MDPAAALDRIVYLLDRDLAEGQKVRAFARARDVVEATDPGDLAALHAAGQLTDLAGIGPTTGRVIAEALAGETPAYLAKLEDETVVPVGEGGDLRTALRGDCHTHSTWSDGGAPVAKMARTAVDLGHEYMVLTDHSPRLTVAHGLTAERLRSQLEEVRALNDELAPFRILTGIEVDILEDGALDQAEDLLAELDVVVASVHSKLRMERREMTQRMVRAVASPHVDILGHCTGRKLVGRGRPPSTFDAELVFAACAQFGTALEINCRPSARTRPTTCWSWRSSGTCDFAIDTDAHAPGQMEWQAYGCDKARPPRHPTPSASSTPGPPTTWWPGPDVTQPDPLTRLP